MKQLHLKRLATFVISVLFTAQVFGQYQNLKWAPLKLTPTPLPSAIQIGYERTVSDQASLGLTTKFFIPQGLENGDITFEVDGVTTAEGNFQSGTFYGVVLTPELRYYTSVRNGAPNGFYLAPFLRYFNYGAQGEFDYRPISGEAPSLIDSKVNFSGFGGGIGLGVQKIWDSGFLIDWNVGVGLALSGIRLQGTAEGPVSDDIPQFVDELTEAFSDLPLVSARLTNNGSGLNARAAGVPWPILKSQLAIGFAF